MDASGSFVNCRKVRVKIRWISLSAGYLVSGRGYLAECVRIIKDIRKKNKDVIPQSICKVLCNCHSNPWCADALYNGVRSQIKEYYRTIKSASLFKLRLEKHGLLMRKTDSCEDDHELVILGSFYLLTCYSLLPRDTDAGVSSDLREQGL